MNILPLVSCYIIGVVGNLTLGPVFILTFNRSARYGFWRGFAAGLGSSVADGILFSFGLLGALSLVMGAKTAEEVLYLAGALALAGLGIYTLRQEGRTISHDVSMPQRSTSLWGAFLKSFVITMANPLAIGYFTAMSMGLLNGSETFRFDFIILASTLVAAGTLTVLTVVSTVAHHVGVAISRHRLAQLSHVTGLFFLCFSGYLLYRFVACLIT